MCQLEYVFNVRMKTTEDMSINGLCCNSRSTEKHNLHHLCSCVSTLQVSPWTRRQRDWTWARLRLWMSNVLLQTDPHGLLVFWAANCFTTPPAHHQPNRQQSTPTIFCPLLSPPPRFPNQRSPKGRYRKCPKGPTIQTRRSTLAPLHKGTLKNEGAMPRPPPNLIGRWTSRSPTHPRVQYSWSSFDLSLLRFSSLLWTCG